MNKHFFELPKAVKTVDKLNSEEMNKVTAGLNVPGLM